MKKRSLALSIFLTLNAFGIHQQDQHQHQHDQQVQQKKDKKKKQQWHSNDDHHGQHQQQEPQSEEEDADIDDLRSDMAAIMQNIIPKDTSVDDFIEGKKKQKSKKMILCYICHRPECPLSQEVSE